MKKISKSIISPAKINLFLRVTGQRTDGYHYIYSLMSKISIYDTVNISITDGNGVSVKCPGFPEIENEQNLVIKATKSLLGADFKGKRIDFLIDKKIPLGGGLGGGSSNAAAALKGLNELFNLGKSVGELALIGSRVGSDIPFFIYDGSAIVEGVGELVTPVKNVPKMELVVINPGHGISTEKVYKMVKIGLTNSVSNVMKDTSFSGIEVILKAVKNDLEPYALEIEPGLKRLLALLEENGAMRSAVSGSGSSVFGIFKDARASESAFQAIQDHLISSKKQARVKLFRASTIG